MSSVNVIPPLKVQSWLKRMEKQIIADSVWEGLSNRIDSTTVIPNGGEGKIPDSVIHYVQDQFKQGVQFTTIPSMDKLILKGKGGLQVVEGSEEKPKLRYKDAYYNVQRKAITIADESVEGDMVKAYSILDQKADLLSDYFAELNDYNKARAIVEGGDIYLTEDEYWTGATINSAPVNVASHPASLWRGAASAATWNVTDSTFRKTNLIGTAATVGLNDAFTDTTVVFNKVALEKMIKYASSNIRKLNWKAGGKTVNWVIVLSETQADQLLSETGDASWLTLFKDAGMRGVDNRAITGVTGVYRGALVMVNPRQPLLDCTPATTYGSEYQYIKPWGDSRVATAKGSDTGTCEMAMCLGRGAIGSAIVKKLAFTKKGKDYEFSTGFEARCSKGDVRMDFGTERPIVNKPLNFSSFIYYTPTPATAY